MATEKQMNTRIQHKVDIEHNWNLAVNFIPKLGEIIIYQAEQDGDTLPKNSDGSLIRDYYITYPRFKIGNGNDHLDALPFVNEPDIQVGAGMYSIRLGSTNIANGAYSISEGNGAVALSNYTHAEGRTTLAGSRAYDIIGISAEEDVNKFFIIDIPYSSFELIYQQLPSDDKFYSVKIQNNYDRIGKLANIEAYEEGAKTKVYVTLNNPSRISPFTDPNDKNLVRDTLGNVIVGGQSNSLILCALPYQGTKDFGGTAHSEGWDTMAIGDCSHTEGADTRAYGRYSHAEGKSTMAGYGAHAEGAGTKALGARSHAEGHSTLADLDAAHAEGYKTEATGYYSHAQNRETIAAGNCAHAEGQGSKANAAEAHAEGYYTTASGQAAHAEGKQTVSGGEASHTEGLGAQATAKAAHAEGQNTQATNVMAHAEGNGSVASGSTSHAEGAATVASGGAAHSEGKNTIAAGNYQHAQGKFNIADNANKYAHIVGNGDSDTARRNAHTLDWSGNAWYAGVVTAGANPVNDMDLVTKQYLNKNTAPAIVNITIEEVKPPLYFYIYDTKYEAEAGMTWAEWCNSAYNTHGLLWVDEYDRVYYSEGYEEVHYYDKSTQLAGDWVYGSHTILETKYVTCNP